ncbi:MAG: hypothetical protein NTY48_05380 [Candidatus Diapherotrites archaeon]|nr:hypothetical protein [Candidatus Diapherotrites archaeon]
MKRRANPVLGRQNPIRSNPTMPIRKNKAKILFVDDDLVVRSAGKRIAQELGHTPRTAEYPFLAKAIINRRLRAAKKLRIRFLSDLKKTKTPEIKALLRKKIAILGLLKNSPVDIIVSDINMPSGRPTGIKFVAYLKKRYPNQKVILHSDDFENAQTIQKNHMDALGNTIPFVTKHQYDPESELRDWIERMLKKKADAAIK